MSLRKVHDFWLRWKPLPKMMNIFLGHFWIFELNHIVFDFGHLNTIKYFKCSNNHKLKCLLLVIFQTVALSSFMIFGSV